MNKENVNFQYDWLTLNQSIGLINFVNTIWGLLCIKLCSIFLGEDFGVVISMVFLCNMFELFSEVERLHFDHNKRWTGFLHLVAFNHVSWFALTAEYSKQHDAVFELK